MPETHQEKMRMKHSYGIGLNREAQILKHQLKMCHIKDRAKLNFSEIYRTKKLLGKIFAHYFGWKEEPWF